MTGTNGARGQRASGRGHPGPSARRAGHAGQRAGAGPGGGLGRQVQEVTGEDVEVAFVDQGYTGEEPAEAAAAHGISWRWSSCRGQAWLRPVAPPLGGRAQFRLAGPLPPLGPRLRAAAGDRGGLISGLRLPDAPSLVHLP